MGAIASPPRLTAIRDRILKMVSGQSAESLAVAGDELEQTRAGLDALEQELETLRANAAEATSKLQDLLELIVALVSFDYQKKAAISERHDILDGVAAGLNMLGEELAASTVSKAYLNDIIESMTDLLVVTDKSARITTVNRGACALTNYSKQELLGQPLSLLFADISIDDIIASGGAAHQERVCRARAGEAVPISFSASVLGNNDQIQGLVCVAQDLTERKRIDEERWRLREAVQRQSIILEELSTPLIPITSDILVLPLVGSLDERRATQMIEALLQGVVSQRARVAIIDITGVRAVDTIAVNGIVRAMQAVRMIGSEVVLTGIRPEVALALVEINADLGGVVTFGTLQSAVDYAIKRRSRDGGGPRR
jgi:rsbT co-antagonist protein RsbR